MREKDNQVCSQTGERICSSVSLCPGCAHGLERLITRMPPQRECTAEEAERIKIRSAKGKKWVIKSQQTS